MSKILVIGDIHAPCERDGYLAFCQDIKKQWQCKEVVFIGDVVDWHAISFHAKHPDSPGPKNEYLLTLQSVQKWYKAFPRAKVCIGNHDNRPVRLGADRNIPEVLIRDYAAMWKTPKWEWADDFTIDDVYYFHGIGYGGIHPAYNAARQMAMSVCMGHAHSTGGVAWFVNPHRRWFGMDIGCGIDDSKYAFAYGKACKRKSVISCGVVIDGTPYHEMMHLEEYK